MSNMRIAVYYEDPRRIHRNDGPPLFWWHSATKLLGKENARHLLPDSSTWKDLGTFALNFWIDWGEDALMPHLPYKPSMCPKPNVYVCSDAHIGYDYRLSIARQADFVFCNQLRCLEEFIRDGIPKDKIAWLPHAVHLDAYPTKSIINKYDVCFIGNMGCWDRVEFCDRMFKEFPNFFFGKRIFEEAAEKYSSSKIVLNHAIKDDINMRVFEVLATKSLLLTPELPTLHHLFKDGVHLVTYKNVDEAVEKAKYYIEHEEERLKIAQAGYDEVIAKHTYTHRLKKVLDTFDMDYPGKKQLVMAGGEKNV